MGRVMAMALGVITAIGGFLDVGELVAMPQAGAEYRFGLLWVVLLGTFGAIVFAELTGRIELASKRTVFDLLRERLGLRLGVVVLAAGLALNLLVLVAELAGMAYILELAFGTGFLWLVAPVGLALIAFNAFGNWKLLENLPSFAGLALLVVPAALLWGGMHVDWSGAGAQVFMPAFEREDVAVYLITAIAVLGAGMTPYEWYFYSSGGREEHWGPSDLAVDRVTAIGGFALGSLLALSLMIGAATLFYPANITPTHLSQTGLIVASPFGKLGMAVFLFGAFACILGAAVEVSLSAAQAATQFFGRPWGSSLPVSRVKGFTAVYCLMTVAATLILLTGVDPIKVTIVALGISVTLLPLTFAPMLLVANDPIYMGHLRNGRLANTLGLAFLLLVTVAGAAAVPLLIGTGGAG